jgi:hypothetical protein
MKNWNRVSVISCFFVLMLAACGKSYYTSTHTPTHYPTPTGGTLTVYPLPGSFATVEKLTQSLD